LRTKFVLFCGSSRIRTYHLCGLPDLQSSA